MNEYEFEKKIQFPSFMSWNYLLYPPAEVKSYNEVTNVNVGK